MTLSGSTIRRRVDLGVMATKGYSAYSPSDFLVSYPGLIFFYEDGFGIKLPTKVDISLNKEIKTNQKVCLYIYFCNFIFGYRISVLQRLIIENTL